MTAPNPIVLKRLSRTDIEVRLTIPRKSLKYFPALIGDDRTVDFPVRDERGVVWVFRLYTRKKNKYLKPVLSKGWREFVRSKELTVGDKIAFYNDKEKADGYSIKYRVRVEKAVKVFDAIFGYKQILG